MGLRTNVFMKSKKGFLFTLDAFLASIILVGGLLLISQHLLSEAPKEHLEFLSTDMLSALAELKMRDIYITNSTFVDNLTKLSNNTDLNLSVLEQIGTYWATNETTLATNLSEYVLNNILPKNTGIKLTAQGLSSGSFGLDEVLFNNSWPQPKNLVVGERMITGINKGSPLTGSTSSAYLRRIRDKRTSSFAYFGGFVGQGNITVKLEGIPADVGPEDINKILIELDAVTNFSVIINGAPCTTLNASTTTMTPERWDITFCNSSIYPGTNNVTLDFQGDLNKAYIMGGNIRVDYKTDELQQTISMTNKSYLFPEIRGIVNLYDSFYIPGNLTSMTIYLHYLADHGVSGLNNTFYLTIGNTAVLVDTDSITEQSRILIDVDLLARGLNYSNLGTKTIPLRMGFENLTYESQYLGNSQIMLVTDTSGSMDWKMNWCSDSCDWGETCPGIPGSGSSACNGFDRNCDDANINDSDTQRLSVAKCLDKQFAQDVLNISGNTLGLVSYDTNTNADTLSPTTNITRINNVIGTANPQTGYSAGGSTCICCGINSANNQLTAGLQRTVLIANKTSWKYNNSFNGAPVNDSNGNAWYEFDFYDTDWPSGNAVLGHDAGTGGVPVNTELGSTIVGSEVVYANLWENAGDVAGAPNDFSSGTLNSTANTFGIGGANDGWDWAGGASAYGFGSQVNFTNIVGGRLNIDIRTGSPARNRCTSYDCSGAYGITVNITPEMIAMLSNGSAVFSFAYEWVSNPTNPFSSYETDEVWVKGKWIEPSGTEHWLGSNLDSSHNGGDADPEIYAVENPDQEFSGVTSIDITQWIHSAGLYYLHFGGKLRADDSDEWGNFYFDNVSIRVSNHTDHYYFRKHFTIADTNVARRAFINLLSDDYAKVYVNGNIVFDNQNELNGTYWDKRGIFVDGSNFKTGDNVVAIELINNAASAKLDLELIGVNSSQQGAMLVMTDGQANVECNEQHTHSATQDAIQAACDARQRWGIQVFAVGYSTSADETTLEGIAKCGEGLYAKSDNTSALSDFYNQVVMNIISATIRSQTVVVSGGNLSASNLYGDSFISYSYTPVTEAPTPNEISVEMQSTQFNNCSATVNLPSGIRIMDAKVTSYSGEHWTRTLAVNSQVVYNLTEYNTNYTTLGDPYLIQAPPYLFINGSNTIYIDTGDNASNSTGCSKNNSLIYTALVPSSTARSGVVERTEGCNWTIQFEDDTNSTKVIPGNYSGSKKCSYTATNHTLADGAYDAEDAYDIAVYSLLKDLDFDDNGKIFVDLDAADIEIVITTVSSVPYLWGPTLIKANVWQ